MSNSLILLGFALVVIGIIIMLLGAAHGKSKVEWGVGGFIGPVPVGFASSPMMLYVIIAFMTVVMLFFLLFRP